jgi:hypothetical protein
LIDQERRRVRRRPILETFSLFIALPSKGGHRLPIVDLSEMGIGFRLDTLGMLAIEQNEVLEMHLYLNQSLYLQLWIKVVRIIPEGDTVVRIGSEFTETQSKSYLGLQSFVGMLDQILDKDD